jgi:hypothetical protein
MRHRNTPARDGQNHTGTHGETVETAEPKLTLNRAEAVRYTSLPRRTFDRLLELGAITNFGTHTRWRFSRAQLDRLLEQGIPREAA